MNLGQSRLPLTKFIIEVFKENFLFEDFCHAFPKSAICLSIAWLSCDKNVTTCEVKQLHDNHFKDVTIKFKSLAIVVGGPLEGTGKEVHIDVAFEIGCQLDKCTCTNCSHYSASKQKRILSFRVEVFEC